MDKNKLVVGVLAMQLFLVFGLDAADKAKIQTQPAIKTDVSKTYDKKTDINKGATLVSPVKYFSATIQLENEVMKLMIEIAGLKEELEFKIREFAIEQTFGSKKTPAKKNPWQMDKILFWKTPLPTSDPVIASLSSTIAEKAASFKKLEADIDSKYKKFVDVLKTYKSLPGSETDKDYIRTLLLYMTTEFRRGVASDLHTELAGLVGDPDCVSDLVSNQPFLKYGVYSLDEKFAYAITTLLLIRQQVGCISSSQLAVADFYSFEAADRTMAVISDDSLKQQFIDLTINPLLIIYDAGKSQFSRGMDYMNEHFEFTKNSYNKNGILHKLGFYLADDTNYALTEVKFGDKAASSYAPDPKTYDPSGITTPFGIDTGILKAMWCGIDKKIPEQSSNQSSSWTAFAESAGDPTFLGFGAGSMKDTIAGGMPDLVGICGGGGGGGGNEGGSSGNITCKGGGGGSGGTQVLNVCHVKAPPIKGPPPASINAGDSGGGSPSTGGMDTKTVAKTFSYKNSFSCPSEGASNPGDEKGPEANVKATNDTMNKQDANKNKGAEAGNKKKDDLAKAADSKADEKAKADAAKNADNAVKNAQVVSGLTKVTKDGQYTIQDDKGNQYAQGDCNGCADGSTHLGDATFQTGDGSVQVIFDSGMLAADSGSSAGASGPDLAQHAWAHAYLFGLGVGNKSGQHHGIFEKAGVQYCSASGDECSAGCNAGEMLMMTYYDCPDDPSSKKGQEEACGNAPAMPGPDGVGICPGSGGGLFGVKKPSGGGGVGITGTSTVGYMMAFPGQVGSVPCEGYTNIADKCIFAVCLEELSPICGSSPLCTAGGGGGMLIDLFKSSTGLGVTDPSPIMEKLPVWMQEQYKQTKFKTQGTPVQQGGAAQKAPQKK